MDIHKNARLTPRGRERIALQVLSGSRINDVAAAAGVCSRTVRKWTARYRAEGAAGLMDRPSRPHRLYRPTPPKILTQIEFLRRQRRTGAQIAKQTGVSPATVSRVLRRLGLHRISALEPPPPVVRYEREHPGELLHIDIKKLARFARVGHRIMGDDQRKNRSKGIGFEAVHVAIDDASRIAFSQILPDQRQNSAIAFLHAAVDYYASLGVRIVRVMTDNGSCYISRAFRKAVAALGLKHITTRPYSPQTNGKAERFIQTAMREWAYAHAYPDSKTRAEALPRWLHRYNWHRPHSSLKSQTPISRLGLNGNNLLRVHI